MALWGNRDKVLGVATKKRRYDLPLNKGAGAGFMILLVSLMAFLAVMALAASFALSAMTDRWSSGLEDRVTVEIPAENEKGEKLDRKAVKTLTNDVAAMLEDHPAVIDLHILDDREIVDLVKPWLGEDLLIQNIPVPGLISLRLQKGNDLNLQVLETRIKEVAPRARLDTHEAWLKDLLRFTGALQFAATLLTLIIGITTATAVAGAVRSRMAIHREEVELLHLMGATDRYIARQFQRHSMILALQGAAMGTIIGGVCLLVIGWISGEMGVNLLPDFSLNAIQVTAILMLPAFIGLIAIVTTGKTVKSVLTSLP